MHEPYDGDEYDDNEYNYDDNEQFDPYKFYFKFDISPNTPISNWLYDIVNDFISPLDHYLGITNIPGFPMQKFPVNSWNPDTGKGSTYQYLGSNYQNSPIWKKQYFIIDSINIQYKLHLQANAKHFVQQPIYYHGLFDILN